MGWNVNFDEYQPPERFDGNPWTDAQIFEAATPDGVGTLIATIALTPPDADPSQPAARSFSTNAGTGPRLWYYVIFSDGVGGQSTPTAVFQNAVSPGYTPDMAAIGALITARTKDANGNEVGTFTELTRPTRDQVGALIDQAVARLEGRVGDAIPATLFGAAAEVIALDVASRVELSFFPDQVSVGRSPYQELQKLHDAQETELLADIAAVGAIEGEDEQAPAGLPRYGFPVDSSPLLLGGSETGNPDVFQTEWM